MFGELGMNADFRGSLIELPTEAASVAELNKSLQRLSSSSRASFAWCHNRIVRRFETSRTTTRRFSRKTLRVPAFQPLFIPAVLRQFNESRTASDVLAAVSRRFSPFDRELDAVFEQFWNLQRAVSQKAYHPARVALALLVSALAAMLDCRPEDIDSRASSRLAESDDLAASDRGLALHLAGIVAGVELVESDDPVMQMCRSFDEACESAEANQDICLPLSCALTAVNHFLKDEAAAKEHFKKLHRQTPLPKPSFPALPRFRNSSCITHPRRTTAPFSRSTSPPSSKAITMAPLQANTTRSFSARHFPGWTKRAALFSRRLSSRWAT